MPGNVISAGVCLLLQFVENGYPFFARKNKVRIFKQMNVSHAGLYHYSPTWRATPPVTEKINISAGCFLIIRDRVFDARGFGMA